MSLIKLLKAPSKLFKKEVITFVIVKRHDLGVNDNRLRYIAVRPNASISVLRQKVWHLLDLPDFCDETIVLKTEDDQEIPLTELRKGNEPQHPFKLEVWLPGNQPSATTILHNGNMIMMGYGSSTVGVNLSTTESIFEEKLTDESNDKLMERNMKSNSVMSNKNLPMHRMKTVENIPNVLHSDFKQSDLSCNISTTSIFYKLHGRKSRDNFANILLKIQTDLNMLSNKLSSLENKIPL